MQKNILVTGGSGFLGRHLKSVFGSKNGEMPPVHFTSSSEFDLTDRSQVREMFATHRPSCLVHLAAYSGGIGANKRYPADFFLLIR